MDFKVVKQLNPIGAMKTFTKTNCNLCMEELLTILKKLRDKHVTVMNNNSEIYGAFRHKTTFHHCSLCTDYPVKLVKGLGRRPSFQNLGFENVNCRF